MTLDEDHDSASSSAADAIVDDPFVSNPYHGEIYPGTSAGLKLYLTAMKPVEESKKVELSIENSILIKSMLTQAASNFGWSKAIAIPILWDQNSKAVNYANLLLNPEKCPIEMVKFHAAHMFGTPDYSAGTIGTMTIRTIDPRSNPLDRPFFQLRVRSDMISKYM